MSITGKSVKSLKKQDLINQKSPAVAFRKISFAHKATLNDTGFNLTTLNPPSELTSNGFSQPSGSELAAISLQFYAKNLTLTSAARGLLVPFQDYTIGGNQQINFLPNFGNALADEIFYGVIDPVAKTGSLVADTNFILKTGTLSAGATDFNVGGSWKTNINPTQQLGAVSVYLDGVLQFRNAGNATAAPSADGNYQEVDNGSGDCTLIKFNIADNLNDRVCMVMSNAISVVRPDGSVNDSIEKIQGSLDTVIATVADLAGVATTNFNAAPTTPQLKQYGDRVIALETNAAYENQANTWSVAQDFSTPGNKIAGRTDGAAVAAGYIGEKITWASAPVTQASTTTVADWTNANIVLTAGTWLVNASIMGLYATGANANDQGWIEAQITDSSNTLVQEMVKQVYISAAAANSVITEGCMSFSFVANLNTTTTYKIRMRHVNGAGTGSGNLRNAVNERSQFFGVRIA